MKLLSYTTGYFSLVLFISITIWAGVFYYSMLDEIYDSIDDGLDNQKGLIIQKAAIDTSILTRSGFGEGDYSISEISSNGVFRMKDEYKDTSMYMQNEDDFEPVRLLKTVFVQDGKYYQLNVVTSMVEEDDLSAQLLYSIIWLYFGLVLTILILNNFLLKRIWKPFHKLIRQLKKFKLETPAEIITTKTRVEEFLIMNETVKGLIRGNIDAYTSQKQFIENASHELQTPLAIAINKLERLAEINEIPQGSSDLLESALENLERLNRLNKSLILLTRIENKQFIEEEELSVNAITHEILANLEELYQFRKIKIDVTEKSSLSIKMNPDLLAVLITNLIKNAISHNYEQGIIRIVINDRSFMIQNSGNEPSLDKEKIFTRFYKPVPGSTTGLGLSIVYSICNVYKLPIVYRYHEYHEFEVVFQPNS
jgi:signal transduction histidine kinase